MKLFRKTLFAWLAALAGGTLPLPAAADVVISEFMASNDRAYLDDDGDDSDWVELFNAGSTAVNLNGWFLTDESANLTRWQFPAVTLQPGKFLVVFASGKDRRNPAAPLHTNFELLSTGEYLALVAPNGSTVVHEYAPMYPPQHEDLSHGLAQNSTLDALVRSDVPARTVVPADGSLGTSWTGITFNHGAWISGNTGVGYDNNPDYLSLIKTNVDAQMDGVNTSAYVRVPFTAANPSRYTGLFLRMKYDDGYVAYLNGTQVASRNAPASPAWNSASTAQHDDAAAVIFEEVDISGSVGLLQNGNNVLAIHGFNANSTSSDFLVLPELDAYAAGALDRSTELYFTRPTPGLGNLAGYPGVAPKPQFSLGGGMITSSVNVALSTNPAGATIRYTLDGSEPTDSSTVYSGPIPITQTRTVRAKGFQPTYAASPTVSEAYVMLAANVRNFSSDLPIVVVETFGQGVNDSFWTPGFAAIMEPQANGRATITQPSQFSGRMALKTRGSSSLGFPKKSYNFEVRDERGNDLDVELFGLAADSDWILYGPYTDKTLMRDHLAYRWSNAIGQYAPRTLFAEVYINTGGGNMDQADYVGVYGFEEKIKRHESRVDIAKLSASDSAEPDITGGYILKKDRLDPGDSGMSTSQGHVLGFVYPKEEYITAAQRTWIKGYLDAFEAALYGANYRDPVNGYAKYIDVASFIDHHIIVEITKNIDGYRLSTFMYKDRNGKLILGPAWDYNLCLGNANYLEGWEPQGWYWELLSDGDYPWYRRLFQDPDFQQKYIDRWYLVRRGGLATSNLLGDISATASLLGESQVRNYQKWPILGSYVWPNWYIGQTYEDEIGFMYDWIQDRVLWWDGLYAGAPVLNRHGGPISPGFNLTMTAPGGPIYYTLNGPDPRRPGGSVDPGAQTYSGAIPLNGNTRVRARAKPAAGWSGLVDVTFVVTTPPLVITEVMYHPPDSLPGSAYNNDDLEFIELKNVGSQPLSLAGFQLKGAVNFTFPAGTLDPGEYVVVVKSAAAFTLLYGAGINVAGEYTGNFSNGGEQVQLFGPLNEPIHDFAYGDYWYLETDGAGFSLVIADPLDPLPMWGDPTSWKASEDMGGSPGADDGSTVTGGRQLPGDSNQDSIIDISDSLSLLLRLFGGSPRPLPCDGASIAEGGNLAVFDVNGDLSVNVTDAIHVLSYLFRSGPSPARGTSCIRVEGCPTACN